MKIILTGVTGFIGAEVLRQALIHPKVTSVIALSRKPLSGPNANNPKLKTVLMEDFTKYPDAVMEELAGAAGCAWSLGLARPGSDLEAYRRINVTFATSAADAFTKKLAPQLDKGQKFRFIYLSGVIAERDQQKKLWYLQEARRIRGEGESIMVDAQRENAEALETYVMRPAFVINAGSGLTHYSVGKNYSIKVDDLAAAILDATINGVQEQTIECKDLVEIGSKALKKLAV